MLKQDERELLRELARQYVAACADPAQKIRRDLWRRHNSLKPTRPLIYVRAFAWKEMPHSQCRIADPFLRTVEDGLRRQLFWYALQDDAVFEPWVTVEAVHACSGWGVEVQRRRSGDPGGSYKVDYPIKTLADIEKLRVPRHAIDEKLTAERAAYADILSHTQPERVRRLA